MGNNNSNNSRNSNPNYETNPSSQTGITRPNSSLPFLNSENSNEIVYLNNNNNRSNIYNETSNVLFPRFETEPYFNNNPNALVIEHQKTKNTKSYKNPIILLKSSLKLEKNAIEKNIYYIEFKYTSLLNFNANFYFNATLKDDKIIPNENFPIIKIPNLNRGNEASFFNKDANLNIEEYFLNKKNNIKSVKGYFDLIIELEALRENGEVECALATFCNFVLYSTPVVQPGIPNSHNPHNSNLNINNKGDILDIQKCGVKIKFETQKLKVKNYWFEMFNIYGLDPSVDNSSNDCEACCVKKKNTIFLPCKHSYTCSDCSVIVRLPNNTCPMCRQVVTDCLILES